jgi:hypothetical protein
LEIVAPGPTCRGKRDQLERKRSSEQDRRADVRGASDDEQRDKH